MAKEWSREEEWFWEGNIQPAVLDFMQNVEEFTILSSGQPDTSEQGLEIVAERQLERVSLHRLVSVRGWPSQLYTRGAQVGQPRVVRPEITARGWIAQAIFELCLSRGADPDLDLALALPTMASYIRYLQRLRWFLSIARITVYLVSQDGQVTVTLPGAAPVNVFAAPNFTPGPSAGGTGKRRKLGLPGASRLQLPLLHALVMGQGSLSRTESIKAVAEWFPEVAQPAPPEFGQRLSIAQNTLMEEGLTEAAGRGNWRITEGGREVHDSYWQEWLVKEGRSEPPASATPS